MKRSKKQKWSKVDVKSDSGSGSLSGSGSKNVWGSRCTTSSWYVCGTWSESGFYDTVMSSVRSNV